MPVKIFCCYAHEDETLLNKLKTQLRPLQRLGLIDVWHDGDINAGTEWEREINEYLNMAQVILLLVSPDFMASDYCYGVEMKRALERHESREAYVIPVILRPIYWQGAPFGKLQALPRSGKPVIDRYWHRLDEALFDVAESIRKVVQESFTDTGTTVPSKGTEIQLPFSNIRSTSEDDTIHSRYLIFLLDQSGSMFDTFSTKQVGHGKKKSEVVATLLNNFLKELIEINMIPQPDGTFRVKNRADISILGYGGRTASSVFSDVLADKAFVGLPDLHMNPIDIEMRRKQEIDETGNIFEISIPIPIWFKPKAGGGTPMCNALQRAKELARQWVANHPNDYPPIIINVTDGMATDGDITIPALELSQVRTTNGHTLLYNVHITGLDTTPIEYPAYDSELPNDKYAKQLFSTSSEVPEETRIRLEFFLGRGIPRGSRGLIFNGDAASIKNMLNLAT